MTSETTDRRADMAEKVVPVMGGRQLIMMIGLPRSGKSTEALKMGHPIVCPDAIRLALHGHSYIQKTEPLVWAIAHTMVEALFEAGHKVVVLDVCNNTKKRRDEWRSKTYLRVFHPITTSADECIKRAESGGREELIPIIERMAAQHEPLDDSELDAGEGRRLVDEKE
jgi:predicted kinase